MNRLVNMRLYVWVGFVCCILAVAGAVLIVCGERVSTAPSVVSVPDSPWVIDGSVSQHANTQGLITYAACASCHMADALGRNDGKIPILAGQSEAILRHKLEKLRLNHSNLPVMLPFAKALTKAELSAVARYISSLPSSLTTVMPAESSVAHRSATTNNTYASYCASCHGRFGEGNDALLAPRLCGQYKPYLMRRLAEIDSNVRGDADAAMRVVTQNIGSDQRAEIALWLASGDCHSNAEG